jgi:hypothetical protein
MGLRGRQAIPAVDCHLDARENGWMIAALAALHAATESGFDGTLTWPDPARDRRESPTTRSSVRATHPNPGG